MKFLLDTNVVLMLAESPGRLRTEVVERLSADDATSVISAVTGWEIAIKWRLGKLPLPEQQHPREWCARLITEFGAEVLPITMTHTTQVADLPDHHGNPFDRLLIAQAQVEALPIVTADREFGAYEVEIIQAR